MLKRSRQAESVLSSVPTSSLDAMVRKLSLWMPLSDEDREVLRSLPFQYRSLDAGQYLVWDGDRPTNSAVILSGYSYRHKIAGNGARQILSIHMKGDLVDLQNALLGTADHNVQMLTAGEVALLPVEIVRDTAFRYPTIGMALWYETLVEGSIFREWVLNVGRRSARARIAHLLCEFALRLEVAELGLQTAYELPITQEQLADAVALTSVHVNRTLMKLEDDGLIGRNRRMISIFDWTKLAEVGDFEPRYLHLNPVPLSWDSTATH